MAVLSGSLFEPAFSEQGSDKGDDGALILRREIGHFTEPSEEPRGARAGDVVAATEFTQTAISYYVADLRLRAVNNAVSF